MGGEWTGYSLSLLVLLIQVTGVHGAMGAELTSLIVAGVLAGVLCVILLFVIPVVCYIRRKSPQQPQTKTRKTRHQPKHMANGDAKHKKPRQQQNGIPMSMMNGGTRSPRHNYKMNVDPPGTVRMAPFHHPHVGPVPMVGTFRGPPPQPIIFGATSYSRGTHPRGMHPRGHYPMGMHTRGTHPGGHPYMAHMGHMGHAQYPPMAHPYFFDQQYPVPVVYFEDSEDSDSDSSASGRSTVRERKSRYHRQFVTSRVPSTIVINDSSSESSGEVDEEREQARQSREVPVQRRRAASPVRQEPVVMRKRSPSRSRSRSPPIAIYQDLRMSTRPPASPARKEEQESSSEFGTFQPSAGPKSGDVTYAPKGNKPQVRDPSPEPEDYTYATVIKPQPVKAQPLHTGDDWGEADQDMGPTSQNIGLSMSERLQGIVEDGWGDSPVIDYGRRDSSEVPAQDLSRTRSDDADLRKSRREDDEVVLRQSRQPDENPYAHSVKRPDTYRPPSPPLDIPSAVVSPRQSLMRDYPSSEPHSPDRPITPPFDGITPRPSVKSRSESPPHPIASTSTNPLSQSQSQKVHRSMFSEDVLKELKQRQKSTENLVEDDESQSRSVNFSPSPATIISREDTIVPPLQFSGIPVPPPPPPPPPPLPY